MVSKCSGLFILQNPSPNGQYFKENDSKIALSFDMEIAAKFMLIFKLAKMRFWDPFHYTPQIIFQNQSVFEKENVNELSFSQIIDESSLRTNLVTILKYFLTVRGDHPVWTRLSLIPTSPGLSDHAWNHFGMLWGVVECQNLVESNFSRWCDFFKLDLKILNDF